MEEYPTRLPLIGDKAPAFSAFSTQGPIHFPQDFKGKWLVFFSHPADFTPVCTTEFMSFAARHEEFRKLNCELLGLSIDSTFSHIAWLRNIRERIEFREMKNVEVQFPVIADLSMEVSKRFGMLQPSASNIQAIRAVFIIDPEATVRAILYYPMTNGRNIDEILRLLTAIQVSDEFKVATPAGWSPGEEVIVPPPSSVQAVEERVSGAGKDYRCVDWFMCLRQMPERQAPRRAAAKRAAPAARKKVAAKK